MQKRKADAPATSDAIQLQIRNRGTFYLSFTDVDDRVYANGTLVNPPKPANATDATATPPAADAAKPKKLKMKRINGKREVQIRRRLQAHIYTPNTNNRFTKKAPEETFASGSKKLKGELNLYNN